MAEPSIQAGGWGAVINVDITVCSCPPHSTVTLVPIHHILKQHAHTTDKYMHGYPQGSCYNSIDGQVIYV